ncbi:hypothetical protein NQZ68_015686 [Dissostichus eleginoides]|nr:hypothetical protein NQZ68_015686 [Dissostichus eleginoides]
MFKFPVRPVRIGAVCPLNLCLENLTFDSCAALSHPEAHIQCGPVCRGSAEEVSVITFGLYYFLYITPPSPHPSPLSELHKLAAATFQASNNGQVQERQEINERTDRGLCLVLKERETMGIVKPHPDLSLTPSPSPTPGPCHFKIDCGEEPLPTRGQRRRQSGVWSRFWTRWIRERNTK